jgi:hypothetical protein
LAPIKASTSRAPFTTHCTAKTDILYHSTN